MMSKLWIVVKVCAGNATAAIAHREKTAQVLVTRLNLSMFRLLSFHHGGIDLRVYLLKYALCIALSIIFLAHLRALAGQDQAACSALNQEYARLRQHLRGEAHVSACDDQAYVTTQVTKIPCTVVERIAEHYLTPRSVLAAKPPESTRASCALYKRESAPCGLSPWPNSTDLRSNSPRPKSTRPRRRRAIPDSRTISALCARLGRPKREAASQKWGSGLG